MTSSFAVAIAKEDTNHKGQHYVIFGFALESLISQPSYVFCQNAA